jgi:hypothetical protein
MDGELGVEVEPEGVGDRRVRALAGEVLRDEAVHPAAALGDAVAHPGGHPPLLAGVLGQRVVMVTEKGRLEEPAVVGGIAVALAHVLDEDEDLVGLEPPIEDLVAHLVRGLVRRLGRGLPDDLDDTRVVGRLAQRLLVRDEDRAVSLRPVLGDDVARSEGDQGGSDAVRQLDQGSLSRPILRSGGFDGHGSPPNQPHRRLCRCPTLPDPHDRHPAEQFG